MDVPNGGHLKKYLFTAVALAAVLALTACGASNAESGEFPRGTLGDLQDTEELHTLFNQDDGQVRIVLLLSPT